MKKLLVIAICCFMLSGCWIVGKGEKVGTIVKLAQQGAFCTTNEAELIRGGMNGGSGSFGIKPFDFTIEDASLLGKVKEAMESGKEVKIKYHQEAFTFCRSDSVNYFLDDIQIIGDKNA